MPASWPRGPRRPGGRHGLRRLRPGWPVAVAGVLAVSLLGVAWFTLRTRGPGGSPDAGRPGVTPRPTGKPVLRPAPLPFPTRADYPAEPGHRYAGDTFGRAAASRPGVTMDTAKGVVTVRMRTDRDHLVAALPMPDAVPEPGRPTMVTARIEIPKARASMAGVFCHGTADRGRITDGYALLLARTGMWWVARIRGDDVDYLRGGRIPPERFLPEKGWGAFVQLSCERRQRGGQWFRVRAGDSATATVSVATSPRGRNAPPTGGQVGVAVLHVELDAATTVRTDLLAVHTTR